MEEQRIRLTPRMIFFVIFLFLVPHISEAAELRLSWKPSRSRDIAGYKVYYGTSSGSYSDVVDVGDVTTFRLENLSDGVRYYVALTAYDRAGNESGFSEEGSAVAMRQVKPIGKEGVQRSQPSHPITDADITGFLARYARCYSQKDKNAFFLLFSERCVQDQKYDFEEIKGIYSNFFDQSQELRLNLHDTDIKIPEGGGLVFGRYYFHVAEVKARYEVDQIRPAPIICTTF
jgi:hypothetical protein